MPDSDQNRRHRWEKVACRNVQAHRLDSREDAGTVSHYPSRMTAELKFRTCNLCEAMCGLVMTLDEGRITDVRADRDDVFSRGHICPKGPAMREVYDDPDRLRRPRRRKRGGAWQELDW